MSKTDDKKIVSFIEERDVFMATEATQEIDLVAKEILVFMK